MRELIFGYFTSNQRIPNPNLRSKARWLNRTGHVTVLIKCLSEDEYEAAFAYCSPNDQFIKRVGRAIVRGRMEAGKTTKFTFKTEEKNPKPIFEKALELVLVAEELTNSKNKAISRTLEVPYSTDKLLFLTEYEAPYWLLNSSIVYGTSNKSFVLHNKMSDVRTLAV